MSARHLLSNALRQGAAAPRSASKIAARPSLTLPRSLATAVGRSPATQTTTLPNGLVVATESNPAAQTATIGTWIDAGSRAETDRTNGTAHFLEHMAFKGTGRRSQHSLELEVENLGAHLNAYTSREQTVYYAKTFRKDVDKAVDIISDILQNSKLETSAIERERDVILREQEEVDKQNEEVVFDHLHAVAFQGQPLGRTILGPKANILSIKQQDLAEYIKTNYSADRMVLVGAGGVEHEELVKLAEKHFSDLPVSQNPLSTGRAGSKTKFIGSEVRVRDDTMPTCNVAIAVEGVSWSSPDYFPMLVMQSIMGNWDRSLGSSPLLSSRLSHIVSSNNLANSFMHFSTSYSDTGLWGVYMVSENFSQLDDLVHFTLREWQRMSTAPTEGEVERAKSQLKASLLLGLDGSTAIAEDIGRQMVTAGKRKTPQEIETALEAITPADIKRVAQKYLWDQDISIAATGQVEGLLDYNRIRADMSSMVW
ncbi:putative MAS1-mitochondrial processing peptidase beta chain precursor [Microstroma glucosiphilum]|uniref:mitochondrial processing peptidase n=1 Tax=Pseudomicrostroma glucosiphilum TaxID=1684307 RepID=A0A316UER8_9BASI|nr:putative MAS1-mitochondrial processing peptidase beta chain precursor [Pseudomicrostroma glucosiphilum]PWN23797.1 putative MAS1-mitochondrial processing peptidase beta chain precursor [Pseudomicrostroma glucosiphilum]